MSRCENCGDDDALLFTCSHCEKQFCADHQFPHHACERFSSGATAASATDSATGTDASGQSTAPATDAPAGGTTPDPDVVAPVARDAARERRPDREGPDPEPPGRGLPSERHATRTLTDWMREQSYTGYVAKVGSLSLLFTAAYYAGLAAVIYG